MKNILEEIIAVKERQVELEKSEVPVSELEESALFERTTLSLVASLTDKQKTGIIAEFKRRSPSKGIINDKATVEGVTKAYTINGASGLSVLTDKAFFGGSNDDLSVARSNALPILRKDFVVDEYQLLQAKAIGADVILLIAACLSPQRVRRYAAFAKRIGLEVLLEIHSETELGHACDEVDMIGVNNRDLKTFKVDTNTSLGLINKIPTNKIAITESGISDIETIVTLKEAGFRGFLIGETFMKEADPAIAFADFIRKLKAKLE
ncbi:MAG: indole-3-glycerol phosphate synthase TrpC [Bacteroidetes bacterium]|nr:MAG: indole-3-glycerol phosphate synthase TrpC [Bacteroidota bacterium]